MLTITVSHETIYFGRHLGVRFHRTLRVPDDGRIYQLPASLGCFPVHRVDDFRHTVPAHWLCTQGVFIPMYQREAMWIEFLGVQGRPHAVKVAVGKVNAISGQRWNQELHNNPQDYLVVPNQPWLDGINAGEGYVRQFVAMPLGTGYTVEGQLTREEQFGGIQIITFPIRVSPIAERFPPWSRALTSGSPLAGTDMGLSGGGRIRQHIYVDQYGSYTYDQHNFGRVYIRIVNSMLYHQITGRKPPPTPITLDTYKECGIPWFTLYDEDKGYLDLSSELHRVESVEEMDKVQGHVVKDGDW